MWRPAQPALLSRAGFQVGPSILPEPHAWRTRPSLEAHVIRHGPTEYFMQHRTNRKPQIAVSDGEIATNLLIVEHMQLLGRLAHLFDRDQIEIGKKTFASPAHSRIDDPLKQDRVCG